MATNSKQQRLAQDIKREIINVINEMKDPRLTSLVVLTVSRVDVTEDLDTAKVHISAMGKDNATAEAVAALNHGAGHIRTEISRRMHIRRAPEFKFVQDESAAYAQRINELLGELNK